MESTARVIARRLRDRGHIAYFAVGGTLRTYRIAVAATNEFCVAVGGNTVAGSIAAINSYLNGVNAIYEHELSVPLNQLTLLTWSTRATM